MGKNKLLTSSRWTHEDGFGTPTQNNISLKCQLKNSFMKFLHKRRPSLSDGNTEIDVFRKNLKHKKVKHMKMTKNSKLPEISNIRFDKFTKDSKLHKRDLVLTPRHKNDFSFRSVSPRANKVAHYDNLHSF